MASELQRVNNEAVRQSESEIATLLKSRDFELARAAADAAGLVDPTPISDGVSMAMSLSVGDWGSAGLSAISMIPYLGDAIGKTAKGAKMAAKLSEIGSKLAGLTKKVETLKAEARTLEHTEAAAAKVVKDRAEKAAAEMQKVDCPKNANRFGVRPNDLPATGTWKGEKGNSHWTSQDGKVSLDYKEGYPDFRTSQPPSVAAEVKLPQQGGAADFSTARKLMREGKGVDAQGNPLAADPKWPGRPDYTPEDYTWHHKEDGVTMQLVKRSVHDKGISGATHAGGTSVVSKPDF